MLGLSKNGSNKKPGHGGKVSNSLVAVSSAAVLAVYGAGYAKTQSAAEQLEAQFATQSSSRSSVRRPAAAARPSGGGVSVQPEARGVPAQPEAQPQTMARLAPAPNPESSVVPGSATPGSASPAPASPVQPASSAAPQKTEPAVTLAPDAFIPGVTPVAPPPQFAKPAVINPNDPPTQGLPPWKDGTYSGWGSCRHGDIEATVVIQAGKIASAAISRCETRYSCDVISELIPQVAKRQSPDVDNVSGATQSGDAFYLAVLDALGKAK